MTHFSILSIHCVYDIQTSILPHTNMCKKQALIQLYRCFDVNELFSEIISCCLILEKNEIIFLTFFYQLSIPRSLSLFLPRSFPFFPLFLITLDNNFFFEQHRYIFKSSHLLHYSSNYNSVFSTITNSTFSHFHNATNFFPQFDHLKSMNSHRRSAFSSSTEFDTTKHFSIIKRINFFLISPFISILLFRTFSFKATSA